MGACRGCYGQKGGDVALILAMGRLKQGRNPKVNKSKLVSKYAFLWPCCLLLSTDLHNVLSLHRHYKLWILIGASFTQGTISSIPIGGSISPEGFLLPVLLLVVIIVTVVIVIVILIVVVDDVSLIL
ncbi:hypothetical protein Tco_0013196 [Tanacetum coccineum]